MFKKLGRICGLNCALQSHAAALQTSRSITRWRRRLFPAKPPQGKLLASVNNRVQLYGWAHRDGGARELAAECGHSGHVCALFVETHGDFILFGARCSIWKLSLRFQYDLQAADEPCLMSCSDVCRARTPPGAGPKHVEVRHAVLCDLEPRVPLTEANGS